MKILVTGATGFIGRSLVQRLRRDGHEVAAWVRSADRARALFGDEIELIEAEGGDSRLRVAMVLTDAVVNLAGEPVLPRRWTQKRRQALVESRVNLTDQIVQAMAEAPFRPRVLISSSAVGYYGDREAVALSEDASPGQGFLAELCTAWEAAAERASRLGARVVTLRTGIVLGRDGGALASLLPLFRVGLGGVLGNGKQIVPWIHLHDLVTLIATVLVDPRYVGPVNATAPHPVTNQELTSELAHALGRRPGPRAPAFVLRATLGEAATALLSSQRALPKKAERLGFRWAFPALRHALADVVDTRDGTLEPLVAGRT